MRRIRPSPIKIILNQKSKQHYKKNKRKRKKKKTMKNNIFPKHSKGKLRRQAQVKNMDYKALPRSLAQDLDIVQLLEWAKSRDVYRQASLRVQPALINMWNGEREGGRRECEGTGVRLACGTKRRHGGFVEEKQTVRIFTDQTKRLPHIRNRIAIFFFFFPN